MRIAVVVMLLLTACGVEVTSVQEPEPRVIQRMLVGCFYALPDGGFKEFACPIDVRCPTCEATSE